MTSPRTHGERRRVGVRRSTAAVDAGSVDVETLLAQPYAHRGLHGPGGPLENSLASVEAAVRLGLGVEVDLRLSRDGVAVVHHDRHLWRMCRDPRRVSRVALHELRAVRLRGSDETVPSADDVFDLVGGRVPVLLDLKVAPRRGDRERMADEVARLVAHTDAPVAAVSFDPLALAAVALRCPSAARGQSGGVSAPSAAAFVTSVSRPLDSLWFMRLSRPHFVSYNVERLPHRSVARARSHFPVLGWTLRCPRMLDRVGPHIDGAIAEGDALPALLRSLDRSRPWSVNTCTAGPRRDARSHPLAKLSSETAAFHGAPRSVRR